MGNSLSESFDAQGSGTTAACIVKKGRTLWTGHCGDSRIAVGNPEAKVIFETKDHKPDDKEEQERIEKLGGEVRSFKYEDDWTVHRMFIKGRNYPGLCMSRSFGDDCVKEPGVTAIPDVKEVTIKEGEKAMVIMASDGVWEFLDTSWVLRAFREVRSSLLIKRNLSRPLVDKYHTAVKRMFSYGEATRKPLW